MNPDASTATQDARAKTTQALAVTIGGREHPMIVPDVFEAFAFAESVNASKVGIETAHGIVTAARPISPEEAARLGSLE